MKKNGFTLVELLAVILIMGLLLLAIVPSMNRLQNQNKNKEYEVYAKSAISASKLYVEDKREGLTSYASWKGCVSISYQKLLDAGLIKPFSNKRYNCTDLEVRVYKGTTNTMKFRSRLRCLDTQNGNKVVYDVSNLEAGGCYAYENT